MKIDIKSVSFKHGTLIKFKNKSFKTVDDCLNFN